MSGAGRSFRTGDLSGPGLGLLRLPAGSVAPKPRKPIPRAKELQGGRGLEGRAASQCTLLLAAFPLCAHRYLSSPDTLCLCACPQHDHLFPYTLVQSVYLCNLVSSPLNPQPAPLPVLPVACTTLGVYFSPPHPPFVCRPCTSSCSCLSGLILSCSPHPLHPPRHAPLTLQDCATSHPCAHPPRMPFTPSTQLPTKTCTSPCPSGSPPP